MSSYVYWLVFSCIGISGVLSSNSIVTCSRGESEYFCADTSSDSWCFEYGSNGTYLNYTDELDLTELEIYIFNYIETNVTETCRDYLRVAVCVTIYPPCTDNGTIVQQLCAENCDALLNEGTCAQESTSVIEAVNDFLADPMIDFTFNCPNMLSFAEGFLNTSLCLDERCFVMSPAVNDSTNTTNMPTPVTVPERCVQLSYLSQGACNRFDLSTDSVVLKYTNMEMNMEFFDLLNGLETLLDNSEVDEICRDAAGYYICNFVFVPCDVTGGNPRPICASSCTKFFRGERCRDTFATIIRFSTIVNYPFNDDCDNTLSHLSKFGLELSASDYKDVCLDLAGILMPNTTMAAATTVTPTINGGSSSNSNDSGPVIISISIIVGLLAVGVLLFIIIMFLVVKKKCRRNTMVLKPTPGVIYDDNNSNTYTGETVHILDGMDGGGGTTCAALTLDDLKALRKEFGNDFTDLLLPGHQVKREDILGQGEFGLVFKGVWTYPTINGSETSTEVAIKTIKNFNSLDKLKSFLRESAVMKNFNHPNVLKVLGISLETEDGLPFILLPYMANGDLKNFLKSKRPDSLAVDKFPKGLEENKLIVMCYQIACGMSYLAENKVVHRDLAARNCMVDDQLNVRVADFGLARDVYASDYYRQESSNKLPVKWMALETLNDRISNEKTDVWSYGVTCWEIFSLGRSPYPTIPNHEIPDYIEEGNRPPKPHLCPNDMYSLMMRCWDVDSMRRINFKEVVLELNELIDDGYIIDNPSVSKAEDDYYILDDPSGSKLEDNDYIIDDPHVSNPNDDYVNA